MRTLFEGCRAVLFDLGLPAYYWAFAVSHQAYVRNRVPRAGQSKTPYELLFGKPPDISEVRQFGCSAIYYEQSEHGKLGAKGHRARFMGVVRGGYAQHCLESGKLVFKCHVVFTQLPSAAVLVPAAAPAATLHELQALLDDALVAEGVEYARSDDSLSVSADDDADLPADELVEVIPADGLELELTGGSDNAIGADGADGAAIPAVPHAEPDSTSPAAAPALRRSTRVVQPIVRLTHPRPQSRAFRRLVRRYVHQAQINSLIRAELERRSTQTTAALPPEGVVGSVVAEDAAPGSPPQSTSPDLATAGVDGEPAYGLAGAIGRGRDR
jgi:hypothetical protein